MSEDEDDEEKKKLLSGRIPTTEWKLFVDLGDSPEGRANLQKICRRYWYPVYCFVCRRFGEAEADDHTQSFFAHLLETQALTKIEPGKGRFRNWLLQAVINHVRDRHKYATRAKRGSGDRPVPFDVAEAQRRYAEDVDPRSSPEQALEAGFISQLLQDAIERLGASYSATSGPEKWAAFSPFLLEAPAKGELKPLAERFDMRPRAVSQAIYVLRERLEAFCEAELKELGSTDAKGELRELAGLG